MKQLIKNGRIIDPVKKTDGVGDILIEEGTFLQIGGNIIPQKEWKVIDVSGYVVAPGFVDLHTHLREPGFEYKETIETGSKSAAQGGFTTLCCMANTQPVNDNGAITQYIVEKAKHASIRVLPIGAISKGLEGVELAEMGELKEAGCIAVSDDGKTVMDSQLMRLAMEYAKGFSLPVITHCIDANLAGDGSMNEGVTSCRLGIHGIPRAAEDMIIARDIQLAELTGAHLHVAHLSTKGGLELIRRAKEIGISVTTEVTPHHLTLTEESCLTYDTHTKMCPPLRIQEDVTALVQGLKEGVIDAIATDHAPHAIIDKEVEFERAAMGIIGFDTAFSLGYRLVLEQGLPLIKLIESMTANPHRILHLNETFFEVGAPADMVVLDLNRKWDYDVSKSFSKGRNSPFHGWKFTGKVVGTLRAGTWVYQEGLG